MGRWAVLAFLLRVPWARLPRPAPLFPRSRFGQSPGGGDAGVPTAGTALRTRGIPLPSPGALLHPCAGPSTPSPAASWWQRLASPVGTARTPAGAGWGAAGVGRTRWARPAAGGWRLQGPRLPPCARFREAGGAHQVCRSCRRAEGAAWCVPSRRRVCACARRGDGARAGRAARAARRRGGGGGGLGPDGGSGRRRCRRTGGDSRRD